MSNLKKGSHTVIKNDDIFDNLSLSEREILRILLDKIENGRKAAGKKFNEYYVCNTDEPYANEVLQLILGGEKLKNECPEAGETLDWEDASNHLYVMIEAYQECPTGGLALSLSIYPIKDRFERGERTKELYDEIMAIS